MSALLSQLETRECKAECAKHEATARAAKRGAAADRAECARFAREQRAKYPGLHGGWSRSEWNLQVQVATHNRLARLTAARRVPAMVAAGNADARAIVAGRDLTSPEDAMQAFYERCDAASESRKSEHCRTFGRAAADRASNLERQSELGRALGEQA